MKKLLLLLMTAAAVTNASAQHMTLFEEYTSENCPPCAATNPGLEALCAANTSKCILIKFEGNAPAASNPNGIYKKQIAQTNLVQVRSSYYALGFNPYARLDGIAFGNGDPTLIGHASFITQARIDSVYALSSPFKLEVTSFKFNKTNDSIFAEVKITSPAAYSPAGASLVLNAAFIQTLDYSSAANKGIPIAYGYSTMASAQNPTGKCGTNGETIFPNVVRQMLPGPGATGTPLASTWTAGQVQNISLSAKLLSHIDYKDQAPGFVVWIQDNTNKRALVAARSKGDVFATNIPMISNINSLSVYPNPATSNATLRINLGYESAANITVTDNMGRIVYTEAQEHLTAGVNEIAIPSQSFAAGMYHISVKTNTGVASTQLSVSK